MLSLEMTAFFCISDILSPFPSWCDEVAVSISRLLLQGSSPEKRKLSFLNVSIEGP